MKAIICLCFLLNGLLAQAQKKGKNPQPAPVSISARPVEPSGNEVWLNLHVQSKPDLTYWLQTSEKQPAPIRQVARDSAAVDAVIRQYTETAKSSGKKLVVLIRSDARTPYAVVAPVLNALRANEIYTYKLLVDPETKQ